MTTQVYRLNQLITNNKDIDDKIKVSGIASNSSDVQEDYAFFAIKGQLTDGQDFIDIAINQGAKVIIYQNSLPLSYQFNHSIYYLKVDNIRKSLSQAAANFYQSQPAIIMAVTGTNGKTSVAHYVMSLWHKLGYRAASIGTLGLICNVDIKITNKLNLTTADPINLHKILAELANCNVQHVIIEASSHGLDQFRLDGVRLNCAAFNNLSHEHLDYHQNMSNYLNAKLRLFTDILAKGTTAVINSADQFAKIIRDGCQFSGKSVLSYGKQLADEIQIHSIDTIDQSQIVNLQFANEFYSFKTKLVGNYQTENLLAALALMIASGENIKDVIEYIDQLEAPPGRMQQISKNIFIDYAHKPLALKLVLNSLRTITKDRLILVFGCGGNRDQQKRALMGDIASKLADIVIITDDNPRFEDPQIIRSQIITGCSKAIEIDSRFMAIKYALSIKENDDVVLIAGRGHEKFQIINGQNISFDDSVVVKQLLDSDD